MSKEQEKEYFEQLKLSAKELIDVIGAENEFEKKIIKMIYGFVRRCFLESRSQKGGVV